MYEKTESIFAVSGNEGSMYAIYDCTNFRYVAGGSLPCVFHRHTQHPLKAKLYDTEEKARKRIVGFTNAYAQYAAKFKDDPNFDLVLPELEVNRIHTPEVETL